MLTKAQTVDIYNVKLAPVFIEQDIPAGIILVQDTSLVQLRREAPDGLQDAHPVRVIGMSDKFIECMGAV